MDAKGNELNVYRTETEFRKHMSIKDIRCKFSFLWSCTK